MPLVQLWEKNPEIILQYNIKQIVSSAGDGILKDNSECSRELKYFLSNAPTEKLFEHLDYCLTNVFDKSGFVLQDIINEFGRRLDYKVEPGLYQGRINQIGYDGLWTAPDGHAIVIEIKTTDAYRINLDTVAEYRNRLIENGRINNPSSILIIVGRNDTGDLEAQIRGSRHAWDARIISMEALKKLLELKIKSDEDQTTSKIQSLLIPFEYTRLDNIIDVIFTTAKDVEKADEEDEILEQPEVKGEKGLPQEHTPRVILDHVRNNSLEALGKREGLSLIAHKRSQYWSSDRTTRVVCPVSKKYRTGFYWYAFHPHQEKFLEEGANSYLVLGCIGHSYTYAIPFQALRKLLPKLNKTDRLERSYWHIHLQPTKNDFYQLVIPHEDNIDLKQYALSV